MIDDLKVTIHRALIKKFLEEGKFYLDPRGKDVSFPRWRLLVYYHRSYAETFFFDSEELYNEYIQAHDNGYNNYYEFAHACNYKLEDYFDVTSELFADLKPFVAEYLLEQYSNRTED